MIEVFDLDLKKVAILQNAYEITEEEEINAVSTLQFSLPINDGKNKYCIPLHFVRYNGGQLYRIITPEKETAEPESIIYSCEHVIATLIDDVMFGAHVVGNLGVYTADSINYVLQHQLKQNWILADCDFKRQFEYGWENENLLTALFSIPNRFTEPYIWQFNTNVYPWQISLKKIDIGADPQFFIRKGKNLLRQKTKTKSGNICTRLYCLGYGEGVNQLTIKDVNNGLPYIQADQKYIDKYGIISRIWVDRRFEDPKSLKERGEAILKGLQEPQQSIDIAVSDLYQLTQADYDKAALGRMVLLVEDNIKTYITGIMRYYDKPGDMRLTLSTKPTDIAQSIADLADRQRIEQVYSQGATQLYAQSVQANATKDVGAVLNFWIPEEMRIINKVIAKITLDQFRSYSKSTSGGGGSSQTSSSGGGSKQTSSSGGGSTATSSSGGGSTATSSSGGGTASTTAEGGGSSETSDSVILKISTTENDPYDDGGPGKANHNHGLKRGDLLALCDKKGKVIGYREFEPSGKHVHGKHSHKFTIPRHAHNINIPAHTHSVSIPAHTHSVNIPEHTHSVNIPEHTHSVNIPEHTHGIEQGIFKFGYPKTARIFVDGKVKGTMELNHDVDLTEWLLDDDKKIRRNTWHNISVVPDDLAYITIDLYIQGFVQSRGGSLY